MIKVKDEVDLDKLVGFKRSEIEGCYEFEDDEPYACGLSIIINQAREIVIYVEDAVEADSIEIPSVLYDLFKMGIIEEVRDE